MCSDILFFTYDLQRDKKIYLFFLNLMLCIKMSVIKYLHVYIKNKTKDPEVCSVNVDFEEIYRFILSVTTTLPRYYFLCELWNTA